MELTSASELTPYEKLAGLIIALQFINRDPAHQRFNWAWASQELLARTIGLSRRTVCSAMKRLEEFEVLVIDHRGGRRPGSSLCYTLGMDKLDRLPRPAAAEHEQKFHTCREGEPPSGCANDDTQLHWRSSRLSTASLTFATWA